MEQLNISDEGSSDPTTSKLEVVETGFEAYHFSHARGHLILARIQHMLACRARGQLMYHARMAIKHRRMAELHWQCADLLNDPEPDLELVHLFEKYIPISGALTSDEYEQLLGGVEPLPKQLDSLGGGEMCPACRNLNLRPASFQSGHSRFITSGMGDLSINDEYSDEELERELSHSAIVHDVKHHELGGLQDIAKRPECLFCRLAANCFMRLSEKEIIVNGFEEAISDFCFDGVIWLSVVPDPTGDHSKNVSSEDGYEANIQLNDPKSPAPTGRTRIILSLLPDGEEPRNSTFEPPVKTLHAEIFPYRKDDGDKNFHVRQWATSYIETTLPQKWLCACETHHGEACSAPPNYEHMEVHEDMLLVDIEDGCLVSGFKSRRYFALSYVWGTSQSTSFQTTAATLKDAMIPGGLSRDNPEIAMTIRDAMQFTHDMKVRYLWVDALCIVQDDGESKYLQIMHMDAIYRQAVLTIVAGDNLDAANGICGLGSRPREDFQRSYQYRPDLLITAKEAVFGDVEVEVMQAKWASRAWTYQERIFSRRLLIFVGSTVYWNCACLSWSESEPNPSEDGPPPWKYYNDPIFRDNPKLYLKGLNLPGDNSFNFVWKNVVMSLADLSLSVEDDILSALGGLENYIAQYFNTSFICGHPTKNFLDFLLWVPLGRAGRRRNAPSIPSWSWAGWLGTLEYPDLEPQRQNHERIRISPPAWDHDIEHRVSNAWPHSTVLDIHTMISKIRLVGSMHNKAPQLAEFGHTMVSMMPVEVRNKEGDCIGCVSVSPLHEVDGMFEAIVLAERLAEFEESTKSALAYWIMLIEWKGDLAQRTGFGLITVKGWHGTDPEWIDVKLG